MTSPKDALLAAAQNSQREAASQACLTWSQKYPGAAKNAPAFVKSIFLHLYAPRAADGGISDTAIIMDSGHLAHWHDTLYVFMTWEKPDGSENAPVRDAVKRFASDLSRLRTKGVEVRQEGARIEISIESPEALRLLVHDFCRHSTAMLDTSSSFMLRPPGSASAYDAQPRNKAFFNTASAMWRNYVVAGQAFAVELPDEALNLLPPRPYASFDDAMAAAAYVSERCGAGHFAINLEHIDVVIALDYHTGPKDLLYGLAPYITVQ